MRSSSFHLSLLVGTALALPAAAYAENIAFNGTGDYSLTRTDTVDGGPKTIDIVTNGAITLNTANVAVASSSGNGTGIGANTTSGTGTINITSGTVTASGNSSIYGIDARSTSGNITVNSQTATSETNPGSRAVYAVSNSGDITINSTTAIGSQRGIHTGALPTNSTSIGTGVTTINSILARATAGGNIGLDAIVGQGRIVNITSGEASLTNATGVAGAGIFVQATEAATVRSDIVNAAGTNQAGIQVNSNGNSTIVSGVVSMSGNTSDAIKTAANGNVDITSGTITVGGANGGRGIYVTDNGARIAGAKTKIESGSITLSGSGSTGIDVTAGNGDTTIDSTGTIRATQGILAASTTGATTITSNVINASSMGIALTTDGNTKITSTSITTTDGGGTGINVTAGTTGGATVDITSGKIASTGQAINAQAATTLTVKSTEITGSGSGISTFSAGSTRIDSGSIALTVTRNNNNANSLGGLGLSVINSGNGDATINSGSIVYTGTGNSVGMTAQHTGTAGSLTINSKDVSVVGNGGYAILGSSQSTAITINSTGAVTTTGTTRSAGGSNAINNQRYADGIDAVSALGAITVNNSGSISTAGVNARGIAVDAGRAIQNFQLAGTTASTAAINVTNSGSIVTAGDGANDVNGVNGVMVGANGINIRADGNAVTLNSTGTIKTSGASSKGVNVLGGFNAAGTPLVGTAGTLTVNVASVETSGVTANGVFVQTTNGAINATVGSAKTTGATSDAIRLAAGVGGTVNATVTGAVSAASGSGLIVDMPGTANITIAAGANVGGSVAGVTVASGAANLSNSGVITAGSGGVAVQLSGANDTVTLRNGSAVTGTIAGGGGVDKAVLNGTGTITSTAQTVAAFSGFDNLTAAAGYWTAGATSSSFNSVNVANGATLEVRGAATGGLTGVVTSNYVADGTLAIRSAGNTGASVLGSQTVSGAGTVLFTGGTSSLSSVNGITTTGGIAVDNGATLLLTGTQGGKMNVLTGGTFTIGNGTTAGLFTGDANVAGTLIVNHSDDYNFTGGLTGAGSLVKQGAGKLTLGTGYAFTGTTTIQGGSIKLAGTVAPTTELDLQGTGTLDFSGTRQTVAELAGNSAAASINVAQGALTVNQTTSTAFAGAITGDGALTKTGTGTLNLTGASTYTGPTTVTGGKLAVNGSIVSPVTVSGGGKLGGVGRVGNVTIGAGGAYAPGNSIGTQNVAGNVVFASGSTYEVETNADGRSDRIIATGTANIATNTTVAVLAEAGNYNRLTTYNILSATGGVTGTFTNVTSNFAFLTPSLSYTTTAVTLRLLRNDVTFASLARTPNQLAVANAINAQGFSGAVYNAAIVLPNGNVPAAYNELTGELFAAVPSVLLDQSRRIRGAVLDRADVDGEGWGIWGQAGRAGIETDATANVSATATDRTTVLSGVDYGMGAWRVGLHAGYVDSDVGVKGRASQANVHTKLVGAYGRWSQDALTVKVGGDYSWHSIKTTRSVTIPGIAGTERSGYDATSQQLFGEVSYALLNGPVTAAPFGGLAYVRTHSDQVVETGSAAALTVASRTRDVKLATAGWHLGGSAPITSNATLLPHLTASFQYAWGDLRGGSVATFGGVGQTFGIAGARLAQATYGLDGGVDVQFGKSVKAGIGGFMSTSRDWSDFGANVSVSFAF